MKLIHTEPVHGPAAQGLVVMICVMAGAVLALVLLIGCGTQPVKVSAAAKSSPACEAWERSGGTGELAEMQQGMKAIRADIKADDAQTLQVDGLAMSSITGMDVIQNAPPVLPRSWANMVLDLNKMGEELVGGDLTSASGHLTLAESYASDLRYALHKQCGF